MPDKDVYLLDEDQIHKIVDAIPGDSAMHKIWGAISIAIYVLVRTGVRIDVAQKLFNTLYAVASQKIHPFEDLPREDVETLNTYIQETSVKVLQKDKFEGSGSKTPYSFQPTEADFSEE